MFEVVGDTEEAARHTAQILGFVAIAVLPGHVKDYSGVNHDMVIMEMKLPETEAGLSVF